MLEAFVKPEAIQLNVACKSWQEALDIGAAPLLADGVIEPSYVEAVKKSHQAMPYMVIAPGIMLAHARPECGAHAIGISLLTLKEPLPVGSELNDPVKLVITFATPDDKSHLKLLEALTEFLMDADRLARFMAVKSPAEAMELLGKGED